MAGKGFSARLLGEPEPDREQGVSQLFPKWTNTVPTATAMLGAAALLGVTGIVWYYFTPEFWRVGYELPLLPHAGGGEQARQYPRYRDLHELPHRCR